MGGRQGLSSKSLLKGPFFATHPYRVRKEIKCQGYQFNLLLTKYLHCPHFPNLCIVAKISIFFQDVWFALIVPRCIHSPSQPPTPLTTVWLSTIFEDVKLMSGPLLGLKWIWLAHLAAVSPDLSDCQQKILVIFFLDFASSDFGEKLAKRIKLCTSSK